MRFRGVVASREARVRRRMGGDGSRAARVARDGAYAATGAVGVGVPHGKQWTGENLSRARDKIVCDLRGESASRWRLRHVLGENTSTGARAAEGHFSLNRKSQWSAPCMMVCVRVSSTPANPSASEKSALQVRRNPSSGSPSS